MLLLFLFHQNKKTKEFGSCLLSENSGQILITHTMKDFEGLSKSFTCESKYVFVLPSLLGGEDYKVGGSYYEFPEQAVTHSSDPTLDKLLIYH